MSDGAVIGALRFVLGADSAQLEAAAARASGALRAASLAGQAAGNAIAGALTRIGGMVAGAFAVESIIRFTGESVAAAAAMGRFAEQAGMSAQQFQGLEHALRDARVPTEQLAQGFAVFSRNLSDLQRGTGPLLDFIRRFAPALEAQFRAATNTSEAFGILTDAVNALGDGHDRVRLLTAAGSEQFARLASTIRQGRGSIEDAARGFQGLSDAQIGAAQDIERRWNDLWRRLRLAAQQAAVGIAESLAATDTVSSIEAIQREITRLDGIFADLERRGRDTGAVLRELNRLYEAQDHLIGEVAKSAERLASAPAPTLRLDPDQLKLANAELQVLMGRLQVLPPQSEFVSQAFRAAWERMSATIRATAESEQIAAAQLTAARLQLLRQEDQARTQALGNALLASETLARRETELSFARQTNLITEAELQRALNLARSEYQLAQLQELQGLGVTISAQEQYEMTLQRINNAYARGAITAEQMGRAQQNAAFAANAAWASALGGIAQNLSQAFGKNKAVATAAAIISTYEAVNKTLATYGATPWGYAAAAAALAAGIANVRAINSTTETSKSASGGGVGGGDGGSGAAPEAGPGQTLLVQGIDPNAIFTGDQVRALAERLIQYQRDGGAVVIQ